MRNVKLENQEFSEESLEQKALKKVRWCQKICWVCCGFYNLHLKWSVQIEKTLNVIIYPNPLYYHSQ